jgi:hypothetical protein
MRRTYLPAWQVQCLAEGRAMRICDAFGVEARAAWKKEIGYHRRSLAETA